MAMFGSARGVRWIAIGASVASMLAGCYPSSFHGPGGDASGDVTASDGMMGMDGADGADVPPPPDVMPFGTCVAPMMCGSNVCPAGHCTTTMPVGCDPLGDGVDPGTSTFSRGTLLTTVAGLTLTANVDALIDVMDSSMFTAGHEALLYVSTGPGAGTFQSVVVHCIATPTQVFIISPAALHVAATAQIQLVPVLHFSSFGSPTMPNVVSASIDPMHPGLGGIVALRVQSTAGVMIRATGYLGGAPPTSMGPGVDGRAAGTGSSQATGGHGGVSCPGAGCSSGGNGGGGANIDVGHPASMASGCMMTPAAGGAASTMQTRFIASFGTGGGSGAFAAGAPGAGGAGGGAVFVAAQSLFGLIDVSGEPGAQSATSSGGGGGGGGTIVFVTPDPAGAMLNAVGGSGSTGNCEGTGGTGGDGEIRVYCMNAGGNPCGTVGTMVPNSTPPRTAHDISTAPF
jgi:hypothetical protein